MDNEHNLIDNEYNQTPTGNEHNLIDNEYN
jgi:hypothetical protein